MMRNIIEIFRSIVIIPIGKLRALLKKSHEKTTEADEVSVVEEVNFQPKPGLEKPGSNKVGFTQTPGGVVIVPNDLAIGKRRALGKIHKVTEGIYIAFIS